MQFSQLRHSLVIVKICKYLIHIFALALTVSDIYNFPIFYLQKLGQGREVQFSQLHHSMANVKIYKRLPKMFAVALTGTAV